MSDYLLNIDYWFFDLINQKGAFDLGDIFFPWITDLHHTIYFRLIFVPLVLFFFIKGFKVRGVLIFLILAVALGANDFTGAQVKNQFLRLRPFENSDIKASQKSPAASKSFYSNHASNMFTFATYTSQFIPILKIPVFFLAIIISYSRVYNGVHYPSDVFFGALVGCIWGFIFAIISKRLLMFLDKWKTRL